MKKNTKYKSKKPPKKENKQVVEIHIYVHATQLFGGGVGLSPCTGTAGNQPPSTYQGVTGGFKQTL